MGPPSREVAVQYQPAWTPAWQSLLWAAQPGRVPCIHCCNPQKFPRCSFMKAITAYQWYTKLSSTESNQCAKWGERIRDASFTIVHFAFCIIRHALCIIRIDYSWFILHCSALRIFHDSRCIIRDSNSHCFLTIILQISGIFFLPTSTFTTSSQDDPPHLGSLTFHQSLHLVFSKHCHLLSSRTSPKSEVNFPEIWSDII